MKTMEARAIISAKDATGMVFSAIAAKIENLAKKAESASRRAGGAAERAGAAASRSEGAGRRGGTAASYVAGAGRNAALAGAGLAGVGGLGAGAAVYAGAQALKRYGETDLALTRIGITAEATDGDIANLNKTVRDTAFQTGNSFDSVAKGLESLVAGGLDLDKALPAIPAISRTAQAAGADIKDMADTALSLNQALGISTDKMQSSFDILVAGGKAGKFELKDMAQNMASLLPTASALGYKGEEGLKKIVSMLQAIRAGTGSSSEAADSMTNIFQKIESEETVKKFKKGGVDLRKEMDATRKSGGDMIETFMKAVDTVTKGDASKIPQFITDLQFARGIRALNQYKNVYQDTMDKVGKASGSADADLERVLKRPQMAINRLAESWDRAKTAVGGYLDKIGVSKGLDFIGDQLEKAVDGGEGVPEWKKAQDAAEKRKQQTIEPQIAGLQETIRQEEDMAREGGLRYKMPVVGPDGSVTQRGGATADERMQNPVLKRLRLKVLELQGKLAAKEIDTSPDALFSPEEVKGWKEAQERNDAVKGGLLPPSRPSGKDMKRVHSEGKIEWGQDRRGSDGSAGENNIMDLPNVEAKLTGEAEVKGETTVKVEVTVTPSGDLIKATADAKAAAAQMTGMLKSGNGPGSTGRSSPDAAAPSRGATGGW